MSRARKAGRFSVRLFLSPTPPLNWRRSRPASECTAERACFGITERDGYLGNWNISGIEQLARCFEADFIQQVLEGGTLRLQTAVQCSAMHRQKLGTLITGGCFGQE